MLPTGSLAPTDGSVLYKTVATPAVTIGGIPADVSFSGIAPGNAGQYQINVAIPSGVKPGDDVPLSHHARRQHRYRNHRGHSKLIRAAAGVVSETSVDMASEFHATRTGCRLFDHVIFLRVHALDHSAPTGEE